MLYLIEYSEGDKREKGAFKEKRSKIVIKSNKIDKTKERPTWVSQMGKLKISHKIN